MKKVWFALTILFTACLLVACGNTQGASLDTIKQKQKIVVATESEFAPFEFKTLVDGKDTLVGADIELAKAIGEKLGVEVEFSVMSFDNVLASLQNGKADLAIAGISVTDERKQVFDFSDAYYTSENVVIVKKDQVETFTSSASLANQSVGTQKGSVQETVAKNQLPDASIVSLTSNGEMINELKSGQLQAVVLEKAIAEGYIAQNEDLTLASFDLKSEGTDSYAIAAPKGSEQLLKEVNSLIAEVKSNGQFDQWLEEASNYQESK